MYPWWVASSLWLAELFSLALTWYGFLGIRKARWWAFALASVLSAYFTIGATSIALAVGILPLLQLSWTLSILFGRWRWWSGLFGMGAWMLWVGLTLTHIL